MIFNIFSLIIFPSSILYLVFDGFLLNKTNKAVDAIYILLLNLLCQFFFCFFFFSSGVLLGRIKRATLFFWLPKPKASKIKNQNQIWKFNRPNLWALETQILQYRSLVCDSKQGHLTFLHNWRMSQKLSYKKKQSEVGESHSTRFINPQICILNLD